MELIWLKLKSELNRLQDTVQRDQRELKISERREMHGEERGAAWKGEPGWECKTQCSCKRWGLQKLLLFMWFSPNQSVEARSRGIFSPCCIKMPIIFCLKLLISESLGEQLPRHIWLNCFSEASSQKLQGEDSFCTLSDGHGRASLHSQPADLIVETLWNNSKAQVFIPQQLGVTKERQFHDSQLMPCTFTLLLGLIPSPLGWQMSPIFFW